MDEPEEVVVVVVVVEVAVRRGKGEVKF